MSSETEGAADIAVLTRDLSKHHRLFRRPVDRLKQWAARGRRQYFDEIRALDRVSFQVQRGESLGIVGRNGSGKSTLLQVLAGITKE